MAFFTLPKTLDFSPNKLHEDLKKNCFRKQLCLPQMLREIFSRYKAVYI